VGVACTDCHNPHPDANINKLANISHTSIQRAQRLPMSVDEPNACYKCHQEQFAQSHMPSHHPILEGKMTCSDCHDPHGRAERNLRADTVNMVCYKCHADKQGPFVHQHAPVEEDCSICHNPHGTVANNLLHQPVTFLCLRCHTGHRSPPSDHFGMGTSDIDNLPYQRAVLFTDCTQCHSQVHGSDLPSQLRQGAFMR
jgi:DmsE family decaheme c-type cytochrome